MRIEKTFAISLAMLILAACGGQAPDPRASARTLTEDGSSSAPFNVTFLYPASGTTVSCSNPPACTEILFQAQGAGYGQDLGDLAISQQHVVVFTDGVPSITGGVFTITARNGTIQGTYSGPVIPTPVAGLTVSQLVTANTGGTRKFAGAGGAGRIDVVGHPDGTYTAAVQGTLTLPRGD